MDTDLMLSDAARFSKETFGYAPAHVRREERKRVRTGSKAMTLPVRPTSPTCAACNGQRWRDIKRPVPGPINLWSSAYSFSSVAKRRPRICARRTNGALVLHRFRHLRHALRTDATMDVRRSVGEDLLRPAFHSSRRCGAALRSRPGTEGDFRACEIPGDDASTVFLTCTVPWRSGGAANRSQT